MSDQPRPRPSLRNLVVPVALGLLALLLVVQLVPYGHDHSSPPVTKAAGLDPATRAIVTEACADCHSNLTRWPWYTSVAPASWLTESDVKGGRKILNFSEWDKSRPGASEIVEQVQSGEMPPLQYKLIHPAARLSKTEKQQLVSGLQATLGR
jgi:hypothetical protein